MVVNPVTINPENSLNEALIIKEKFNISGIPVVQRNTKKLVGISQTEIFDLQKNCHNQLKRL